MLHCILYFNVNMRLTTHYVNFIFVLIYFMSMKNTVLLFICMQLYIKHVTIYIYDDIYCHSSGEKVKYF